MVLVFSSTNGVFTRAGGVGGMDFAVAVTPSSTGVGLQHCCGAGLVAGAGVAAGGAQGGCGAPLRVL